MKPRLYLGLGRFWGCIGWFKMEFFTIFSFQIKIYEPDLNYLFMFALQIAKFAIEFGIDLRKE